MPTIHRFAVKHQHANHQQLLNNAKALGFSHIIDIKREELYFIEGELTFHDKKRLSEELLSDPVVEICQEDIETFDQVIEIALRPGVTDPIAEQIIHGSHLLGIINVTRAATGQRFIIQSGATLSNNELELLAKRLLANPVIHHYALGNITPAFPQAATINQNIEIISLQNLTQDELIQLAKERRSALDLAEMQAIQTYYRKQQRDPSDVEFETIAQTWSEHCSHKTFRADIELNHQTIHGLLKTYIRSATQQINAPWVWSAFVDNAGIIDFDDEYQVSFKVETHNHPSAIEPFGGANTGLGGVIRDVLGVSAKPIAATDIFCFGPLELPAENLPEGTLHPRLIQAGVVAGVQDYGNKTGIPTVNGAIWYDPGYTANPLVYCGCVGLAPKNKHPRQPQNGDRVIILGGRTGRDGLRGATFSSMTMDAQTGEVAGASVQIGDPIIAKGLIEVVTRARDLGLYNAITDCGAGGLSSAVGEMASTTGVDVDLKHVQLKYPGLAPWEIWLSEAQERMALAVPTEKVQALQSICDIYNIELTNLGAFNNSQQLTVRYCDNIVLQLNNNFLYEGMPKKKLKAEIKKINSSSYITNNAPTINPTEALLKLLAHPNIASKENIIRRYDHEVQAGTVIKPLTGIKNDGPSDACVLKPFGTKGLRGITLSNGLNPEFGKYDAYKMALSVVDEAIRNAIAVGSDPTRIAILDNFCWGDPNRPETLGALVEAARGCYDAALHYQTPFISGKDSLNNEYYSADNQRHAIPATLLISAISIMPDVTKAVTMDFKGTGNIIYLLGETKAELLGSHFALIGGNIDHHQHVPDLPQQAPAIYRALHQTMQDKLILACHDLSEGGLAVALAEMCMAGRMGCEINLPDSDATVLLFSESNGRLLVEVKPEHAQAFESCFSDELKSLVTKLGNTINNEKLLVKHNKQPLIELPINQLLQYWQKI